jgi:hypothetical protein
LCSPPGLVEQIPYARCLKSKKKSTLTARCLKLVALSLVTVNFESFTKKTPASSQSHTYTPKIHHQYWWWIWNWGLFQPVPRAWCRGQCDIPFDYCSVALEQTVLQCLDIAWLCRLSATGCCLGSPDTTSDHFLLYVLFCHATSVLVVGLTVLHPLCWTGWRFCFILI